MFLFRSTKKQADDDDAESASDDESGSEGSSYYTDDEEEDSSGSEDEKVVEKEGGKEEEKVVEKTNPEGGHLPDANGQDTTVANGDEAKEAALIEHKEAEGPGDDDGKREEASAAKTIHPPPAVAPNANEAAERPVVERSSAADVGDDAADVPPSVVAADRHRRRPRPVVFCGPSGVGKGTLISMLMKHFPQNQFGFSVSHTTRKPREGEVEGVHYHFTSVESMKRDIAHGKFIEHAEVHGRYYGTSVAAVERVQREGKICLLDIDVQGVRNVKTSSLQPYYVFVAPPSMDALESRLRGRGTESEQDLAIRLNNAADELAYGREAGNFDQVFVNDELQATFRSMAEKFKGWYPDLVEAEEASEPTRNDDNDVNKEDEANVAGETATSSFSVVTSSPDDDDTGAAAAVASENGGGSGSGETTGMTTNDPPKGIGRGADDDATNGNNGNRNNDEQDGVPIGSGEDGASDDESSSSSEEEEDDDDDDNLHGTTLAERRSLLLLAAEHDRVDVLKTLLRGDSGGGGSEGGGGGGRPAASSPKSPAAADVDLVELLLNNSRRNPKAMRFGFDDDGANGEGGGGGGGAVHEEDDKDDVDDADGVFVPPLHVAVSYGSTHATSCLLRMGSDPSIRPVVPKGYVPPATDGDGGDDGGSARNWRKYHGMTAWELAFGSSSDPSDEEEEGGADGNESEEEEEAVETTSRGWFGFGRSSSGGGGGGGGAKSSDKDAPASNGSASSQAKERGGGGKRRRKKSPLNIPPSKLEGIRHAFTAEALRAIGSDEVDRLKQLLDSGMDGTIEIGGRDMSSWCDEMGAGRCGTMLRSRLGGGGGALSKIKSKGGGDMGGDGSSDEAATSGGRNDAVLDATTPSAANSGAATAAVPSHGPSVAPSDDDETTLRSLRNKLEEIDSLGSALASCLDNLAEEASVCQGLLLNHGSSASLVSHVRSLKAVRADKEEELRRLTHLWDSKEEELNYLWEHVADDALRKELLEGDLKGLWEADAEGSASSEDDMAGVEEEDDADGTKRANLMAQIASSENKVRKMRASISDLAEENAKNLGEIEKLGLSGAVNFARTLREELREVEFAISRAKDGEASSRAKIGLVRSRLDRGPAAAPPDDAPLQRITEEESGGDEQNGKDALPVKNGERKTADGENTALKQGNGSVEEFTEDAAIDVEKDSTEDVPSSLSTDALVSEEESRGDSGQGAPSAEKGDSRPEDEVISKDDAEPSSQGSGERSAPTEDIAGDRSLGASVSIASGQSTSIVVSSAGKRGGLTVQIWDLICRIVGLGKEAVRRSSGDPRNEGSNIMIV